MFICVKWHACTLTNWLSCHFLTFLGNFHDVSEEKCMFLCLGPGIACMGFHLIGCGYGCITVSRLLLWIIVLLHDLLKEFFDFLLWHLDSLMMQNDELWNGNVISKLALSWLRIFNLLMNLLICFLPWFSPKTMVPIQLNAKDILYIFS